MLVLYPFNLSNIPPQNLCLEKVASVTSGPAGRIYLNVSTGFVECWNGSSTLIMGAPASTLANANTIALRDSSGNLTATTFNGALNGNASTATVSANTFLLGSQNGAYYLARANATGTQLASTISDFTSTVRTNSLDQFALAAATINLNQQQIINLADPVNTQDAVNKRYVDNNVSFVESNFLSLAVYDPAATGVVNYAVTATLLAGVSPSYYLSRSNHTGTQPASTISNFTSTVQNLTIDSLAPPAGPLNMNGQKLTVLASPGIGTDAANKAYVDNSISAIPAPNWNNLLGIPALRGTFQSLPTVGDTSALQQSEAEGYDHYYFMSTSGWRRILSVPFRTWVTPPLAHNSTGTIGQVAYDSSWFYFCCTANNWGRIALATWAGGTPFLASAAVPAGYIYCDGSYFYIATAVNTWQRFAITSSWSLTFSLATTPTRSYSPGMTGMEAMDQNGGNNYWLYCWSQNQWAYAQGTVAF